MFDKLPAAWLQLRYQKVRLIVALSGVVFSVVIIFMQFGLRDALFDSSALFYEGLQGDSFLISPRSASIIAMESFPRRRLLQALAFPEVDFVNSIYVGQAQWKNPATNNSWRNIFVVGFDLRHNIFSFPGVAENSNQLKISDAVLFDRQSRIEFGPVASLFEQQGVVTTEIGVGSSNRQVKVVGLFQLGASFGADGNVITSDFNFLRIFGDRPAGGINLGLIKLKPDTNVQQFNYKLSKYLPKDVKVLSKEELISFEKNHWQSGTAIGFIFGLGSLLGIIVGIVVVYQILYTNVSEHLPEYATLKAIGYRHQYLLSLILQQAFFIAILGYIPGFLVSEILYTITQQATLLPIAMKFDRAIWVLIATIIMCFISGTSAVTKLKDADPADIF
jgi:putative ABC transport system permease protein